MAESDPEACRVVKANLPKVRRVLEGFALEVKKNSPASLTLLDVISEQGDLSPGLVNYVDKLDRPKDKAVVKSRIRTLLRLAVCADGYGRGVAVGRDLVQENLPAWMMPIW